MQINECLHVDADAFFNQITKEVIYDIHASTNKTVREKQIKKGYSYMKKMKNKIGRSGEVKVTITDFERPRIYAAKFESATGTNFMSYEIEQLDDPATIGVTYTEDFEGMNTSKSLNHKVTMFFYRRKSEKNAKKRLRKMEAYLKQQVQQEHEDTTETE